MGRLGPNIEIAIWELTRPNQQRERALVPVDPHKEDPGEAFMIVLSGSVRFVCRPVGEEPEFMTGTSSGKFRKGDALWYRSEVAHSYYALSDKAVVLHCRWPLPTASFEVRSRP